MKAFEELFTDFPIRKIKKGHIILSPEDKRRRIVYWIQEGFVQKYYSSPNGDMLYVSLFDPSSFLPLSASINNSPIHFTYEALTDIVVMEIPQDIFLKTLNSDPVFMKTTLAYVLQETTLLKEKLVYFTLENALTRLVYGLCFFAGYFGKPQNNETLFEVVLSQNAISNWLGLTRESVNSQLAYLASQYLIRFEGKRIIIPDINHLKQSVLHEKNLAIRQSIKKLFLHYQAE
jgi:CRP-like cAMP-binding protein